MHRLICERICELLGPHSFGKVNVLVNNASKQYICKEFADIDLEKTQDIFKTNIIQMIAMAKFALPHMCRGESYVLPIPPLLPQQRSYAQCSIIDTSSVVAFGGSGTMVDYTATKGAIVGFTKSLGAH